MELRARVICATRVEGQRKGRGDDLQQLANELQWSEMKNDRGQRALYLMRYKFRIEPGVCFFVLCVRGFSQWAVTRNRP